jgi:NAD-dependent dihydropyrimidine dehydrogenase PreA subunit
MFDGSNVNQGKLGVRSGCAGFPFSNVERRDWHNMHSTARSSSTAVIDRSLCSGCGICGEICPQNTIQITYVGYVDSERCVGCGACVEKCPVRAIRLSKKTSETKNDGAPTECSNG